MAAIPPSLSYRFPAAARSPADTIATLLAAGAVVLLAVALLLHGHAIAASTDDFCNRLAATAASVFAATRTMYLEWTGRIVTTSLLNLTFGAVDIPDLWRVSLALAALLIASAWPIARFSLVPRRGPILPVAAFALGGAVLGLYALLGQSVFWATGGIVYAVPMLLVLLWLASMRRLLLLGDPGWGRAAGFAFGLLVGNSIELAVPVALIYGAGMLALLRQQLDTRVRSIAAWRLAGVTAGAVLLVVAPGNRVRAAATTNSFSTDIGYLASEAWRMITALAQAGAPMLWLVVVLVAAAWALARLPGLGAASGDSRADPPPPGPGIGKEATLLFVGGLASVVPVLAVPPQFAARNGFFLFLAWWLAALVLIVPRALARRGGALALAGLALIASIAATHRVRDDTIVALVIKARAAELDATIRRAAAGGERAVAVAPLGVAPPPTVHAIELAREPARWDNVCVARYYGVASVRREP